MEDHQIIDLYWARSESALSETAGKYGRYCHYIAYGILHNDEDSEECVNDTYLRAWNSMPPHRPEKLSAFLGKIVRNLSLNRYELYTAEKRGGGQIALALDELEECIPAGSEVDLPVRENALVDAINRFLASMPAESRKLFMRRYWYFRSIKEIALEYGLSESKVKMTLLRARNSLKQFLEKEGIDI